jgi:c-di-GMP-binding flagellar brake protein YcgR
MRKRAKSSSKPPPLFGHGEEGQLQTAGGQHWPVRVTEHDGDLLMLVLLVEPEELAQRQIESPTFETTTKHGVARFRGEALLEGHDMVRFRVLEEPTVEQRRAFVRVVAPQPVVLEVSGSATIDSAFAVNLSGGGMLLSGPETLELDDHIRFRLHLDADTPPIRGKARVVRCADAEQRALVFEQITRQDRERLIHFIFDRQRMERAKTRGEDA